MDQITLSVIYGLIRGIPYLINKYESKSKKTLSIFPSELEKRGVSAIEEYRQNVGSKHFWFLLSGGTRQLSGFEKQTKKRVMGFVKAGSMKTDFARYRLPGLPSIVMVLMTAFFVVAGMPKSGRSQDMEIKGQAEQRSSVVAVPENFVLIRGGEFTMGSPIYEPERSAHEVQHQVKVSDFYMSKYEVTQAEWESVIGANPFDFKGKIFSAEQVSWDDCQAFIKALNRKTGKKYRLPTEAEWEYACRAGTTTPFNTGGNLTTEQASFNGSYSYNENQRCKYTEKTIAVDSFAPNAWGLYNMHGNVSEWCSDWYDENYYAACKAKGFVENPTGPASGECRVMRGGLRYGYAKSCRSAYRCSSTSDFRAYGVGLRLVFVP